MGKSLSQTLGLKDPLDDAIHGFIKPGPQQNNYQAPPWWGPVKPTGSPTAGGWTQHAALPTAPLAGLPAYVPPAGAPAPVPPPGAGVAPPGARPMQVSTPGAAPIAPSPAALAAGLANVGSRSAVADPNFGKNPAPAGVVNKVNGVVVPVGAQLPPGVR